MKRLLGTILTFAMFPTLSNGQAGYMQMSTIQQEAVQEQIGQLSLAYVQFDKQGDYSDAVAAAKKCSEMVMTVHGEEAGCQHYYATALQTGKGVPRDEKKAFEILQDLYNIDPWMDAPDLAQAYLDGMGVDENPVEASVLMWKYEHDGALTWPNDLFIKYDDTSMVKQNKAIDARLDEIMTPTQWQEATAEELVLYPKLVHQIAMRKLEHLLFSVGVVCLLLLWVWARSRRKPRRPNADRPRPPRPRSSTS